MFVLFNLKIFFDAFALESGTGQMRTIQQQASIGYEIYCSLLYICYLVAIGSVYDQNLSGVF